MIHIATVHYKTDKWIDIQLNYIEKYLKSPYRMYAFLNGIKKDHSSKFYYTSTENIKEHAEKLNILAQKICENADDSDLIIFIDGDAFPINNLDTFLDEKLKQFPLIAIKRNIDFGDCQPHPSFCVTSVGFWKKINANWNKGHKWINEITNRELSDVGGNLLKILLDNNYEWYPMLRTNKTNIHPQWFAVYDNLIYHHGAGFRVPVSKVDTFLITRSFSKIDKILSQIFLVRSLFYSKKFRENRKLSKMVFDAIKNDFNFYENLGLK